MKTDGESVNCGHASAAARQDVEVEGDVCFWGPLEEGVKRFLSLLLRNEVLETKTSNVVNILAQFFPPSSHHLLN